MWVCVCEMPFERVINPCRNLSIGPQLAGGTPDSSTNYDQALGARILWFAMFRLRARLFTLSTVVLSSGKANVALFCYQAVERSSLQPNKPGDI